MRQKSRYGLFLGLGFIAVVGVWLFRDPLRSRIAQSATLSNPTPPPELVEEIISASPDRPAAILAAWNTGKIVHRQVAAREVSRAFLAGQSLPAELESIALAGALDAGLRRAPKCRCPGELKPGR